MKNLRKFFLMMGSILLIFIVGCSSHANKDLQIVAKPQPNSQDTIDLFIKDGISGKEELYKTIHDAYLLHYNSFNSINGDLYIIRRIGSVDNADSNWSDELWKYTPQKKETKIFSVRGLDFRVAPNEKTIAITGEGNNQLIFFNDRGTELIRYNTVDFTTGKESNDYSPRIGLLKWSDNSESFWGALASGGSEETIFNINISTWVVKKYDISKLSMGWESELNANKGLLLYSDYPIMLDITSVELFANSKKHVNLYVYDLNNQSQKQISSSIAKEFKPKWVDDNTIEFDSPNSAERQQYKIN